MLYQWDSRNWNWDNHCAKFHQQNQVIDEWLAAGLATRMSKEDKVSAFLRTIPKDSKNSRILIAKGIIKHDRSRFPTRVGNVIHHLALSIKAKEHGMPNAKCIIANMNSTSGQHSGK